MRLPLFPTTTRIDKFQGQSRLNIGGCDLVDLAERFGTPLYLIDQATLDHSLQKYRRALEERYPGPSAITYAGKAFLCLAMARWVSRQGLWLDCTGGAELAIGVTAGVDRERLLVHGVNKSPTDLVSAVAQAGVIVVDNLTELERLTVLAQNTLHPLPKLWLRLRPGLAVDTHAYTQTGQEDSKFGMRLEEARQAALFAIENRLPLEGLHFHQGSHFHDPAPIRAAFDVVLDLAAELSSAHGWTPSVISPGGGWGVAYHEEELPHPPLEDYVAFIARSLQEGCQARGLPLPRLQLEPGRSLIALAGVAVYRVGTVKHTSHRRWLLVDGGMTDNPRRALYGARYSALPVVDPGRPDAGPAWVGGPYCESGDILIEGLPLPDIQPGELLAIPVSGAYHLSMSSNYNGALRPAVVWLDQGVPKLILRRETAEDLMRRDEI
jgi:diaminopimelate decarboxylase